MKAIVTGHTRGLGAAIARELCERGIPVLGLARGASAALAADFPRLLHEVELDLSDSAALTAWLAGPALAACLDGCGTVLLINNAGLLGPVGPLAVQSAGEVARSVALNVAAPLALAAAVVQAAPGAHKRIVHIASGAARNAYAGWSVYCATKAALDHHARAVALDGQPDVRVCSLAPGVVDTQMQEQIRATSEQDFPLRERFVQLQAQGGLTPPAVAGRVVVDYVLADAFGVKPVDDVRG